MNPSTAFAAVLADELARCGLREVVVAPGSRSTPLAMAFWGLSIPLGSMLGVFLGGQLTAKFGWRATFAMVAVTRFKSWTRSSEVKNGVFSGFSPTPTMSLSTRRRPRRITSRWPKCTGSKTPV